MISKKIDYLLSPIAIRERANKIYQLALEGKTNFEIDYSKLPGLAQMVVDEIKTNYPDLNIPFHTRWNHFNVGNFNRISLLDQKLLCLPKIDQAKARFDLALVSVLLDAGAGMSWRYRDPVSGMTYSKSEGLAVASFNAFMDGAFSSDPKRPYRVDSVGLINLTSETLASIFQVSESNELVGLDGRKSLLNRLGEILERDEDRFGSWVARPGNLLYNLKTYYGDKIEAKDLLSEVLLGFGQIWPGRVFLDSFNLGDSWVYPLGGAESVENIVPFHKLSQWLTLSLIDPVEYLGIKVINVDGLTGLPEYRNGGLFVDGGVLVPRNSDVLTKGHSPGDPTIVEWRALTIVLLDLIADEVRKILNKSKDEFPLAKVLEGGTWSTGRKLASKLRKDGGSPIKIISDGTVF